MLCVPYVLIISESTPSEPPPDTGRISASIIAPSGMRQRCVRGDMKSVISASIPDSRIIAAATRIPIIGGNIDITVLSPFSAPSRKQP